MRAMRKVWMTAALLPLLATADQHVIGLSFGKKKVPVTINHPASLAVALKGKTVAITPVGDNPCTQPFADQLEQLFQTNGVNLVDRANLAAIIKEQHFEVSDVVDANTAMQLGKVSGMAAIIFVRVNRCSVRQDEPLIAQQFIGPPARISRTEAHFQASIRTVDLATGRVLGTNPLKADEQRQNQSTAGLQPEYPSSEEVQDLALQRAVQQANHLYFPWVENRTVAFMDSKNCNLKQEYDLLRTGDLESVLKLAIDNAQACKSDPKPTHEADALYNLGVTYMLMRRYREALDSLSQSQQIHSDNTVIETIVECKRARDQEMATQYQVEHNADPAPVPKPKPQQVDGGQSLNNDAIVEMVRGKLADTMIIKEIAHEPCNFALKPADLVALKKAGVSDTIIDAMLDKK